VDHRLTGNPLLYRKYFKSKKSFLIKNLPEGKYVQGPACRSTDVYSNDLKDMDMVNKHSC